MQRYLYIFEDGTMKQTTRRPNTEEILSILDGVLIVISVIASTPFIEFLDNEGGRKEIEEL